MDSTYICIKMNVNSSFLALKFFKESLKVLCQEEEEGEE